ncbi:hypothetical protein G9A89_023995 [Geosiphon pyriformis]|nr:hypothetical protein G9A89_023995 [Geosiphon pyriformis]
MQKVIFTWRTNLSKLIRVLNIQQPVESDSEEYESKPNNAAATQEQVKSTLETPQTFGNLHPWGQYSWTKLLEEYGSLFGNLIPTINKTDGNMSTWEPPPIQLLTKTSTTLFEETAILQPIEKINKKKQPELAPREHSSIQTPNLSTLTSKASPTHQIMAYQDIVKLEKFSGKQNETYT